MSFKRLFKNLDNSSNGHKQVYNVLLELFPLHDVYVEYPYSEILKRYYKSNFVPIENQDQYLLKKSAQLSADIYDMTIATIIEINGIQHYEPVFWSKKVSEEQAISTYSRQKITDNIKRSISKESETKLVEIHYKELKDLDKFYLLERL